MIKMVCKAKVTHRRARVTIVAAIVAPTPRYIRPIGFTSTAVDHRSNTIASTPPDTTMPAVRSIPMRAPRFVYPVSAWKTTAIAAIMAASHVLVLSAMLAGCVSGILLGARARF